MSRQKYLLIAAGILVSALLLLCTKLLLNDEPSYNGKSLSAWLKQLDSQYNNPAGTSEKDYQEARNALISMGTNIFPHLVRMIETDDPKFLRWLHRISRPVFDLTQAIEPARERQQRASRIVMALGPEALPMLPELIRLTREGRTQGARLAAMYAMQIFKDKRVEIAPALIHAMNDTNLYLHSHAVLMLRIIEVRTPEVVPALTNILLKSLVDARGEAASALGEIGPAASNAVPALLEALNDPEPGNRANAAAALGQIGVKSDGIRKAISAKTNDVKSVQVQVLEALRKLSL